MATQVPITATAENGPLLARIGSSYVRILNQHAEQFLVDFEDLHKLQALLDNVRKSAPFEAWTYRTS